MSTPTQHLTDADLARLVQSLIRAEQDDLICDGKMARGCHIDARLGPLGGTCFDMLSVDEEHLGFDSLSRLALVERVNRFFGLSATGVEDYLLVHRSLPDWVKLVGEHLRLVGAEAAITFGTSGSTGPVSYHTHSLAALWSEVDAHCKDVFAGADRPARVLASVPVHHIYGFLWAVLLPCALAVPAVDLPAGSAMAVMREAREGDLIVTTPFGWAAFPEDAPQIPSGICGVSSGAPTTAQTWAQGRRLGLQRLIEVYGSSETAGIGWRVDETAPFTLCSDIFVEAQNSVDPKLTRPFAGLLPLQDHLEWIDGPHFLVAGRKDRAIQVGGVNVRLGDVSAALEAAPDVRAAIVRPDGDRLKAFVVPARENLDLIELEGALRQKLNHLPAPARPWRFTFGADLPRTATGKLTDWPVA